MSEPIIPGGFILLSRKIIESEIWSKPPLYIKVWIYLLTKAQHSDYKKLKKGQLLTSIPEIIEACSWKVGYRTEKPTKDQIYQILDWLRKGDEGGNGSNERATMITTTRATHGLLINISNYGLYQDISNYESNDETDDEKATKRIREQRQPDNINKNDKNDNNIYSPDFEKFWQVYPRRVGKKRAFALWKARLKEHDAETIIKCAMNYAEHCKRLKTEEQYIKHPSTFLSAKQDYLDYIEPVNTLRVINGSANVVTVTEEEREWLAEMERRQRERNQAANGQRRSVGDIP